MAETQGGRLQYPGGIGDVGPGVVDKGATGVRGDPFQRGYRGVVDGQLSDEGGFGVQGEGTGIAYGGPSGTARRSRG